MPPKSLRLEAGQPYALRLGDSVAQRWSADLDGFVELTLPSTADTPSACSVSGGSAEATVGGKVLRGGLKDLRPRQPGQKEKLWRCALIFEPETQTVRLEVLRKAASVGAADAEPGAKRARLDAAGGGEEEELELDEDVDFGAGAGAGFDAPPPGEEEGDDGLWAGMDMAGDDDKGDKPSGG
eukprot:Hpha_TRINITY_DN27396_c0_g1::TRINITY_DN27396_c0_g1_i1::g.661::m.661